MTIKIYDGGLHELEQVSMLIAEIKDEALLMLSLSDREHLDPLKDLKNTPQSGCACGLADLIGDRLSSLSEPLTKQKLGGAVHKQAQRHHHHERHEPRGLL